MAVINQATTVAGEGDASIEVDGRSVAKVDAGDVEQAATKLARQHGWADGAPTPSEFVYHKNREGVTEIDFCQLQIGD